MPILPDKFTFSYRGALFGFWPGFIEFKMSSTAKATACQWLLVYAAVMKVKILLRVQRECFTKGLFIECPGYIDLSSSISLRDSILLSCTTSFFGHNQYNQRHKNHHWR